MSEGSLAAPTRHAIDWRNPDFYDEARLQAELDRVFDVCHSCRRCFNLCDSFPKLFDLFDNSPTGEIDGIDRKDYKQVVDACTLCDMCYMVSCPYVPPHQWDIDFPHLMIRYRAVENRRRQRRWPQLARQLTKTDRNGRLAGLTAPLANWGNARRNTLARKVLAKVVGVHRDAELPRFHGDTFVKRARTPVARDETAPAAGRKAVLYATCMVNYNNPAIGEAARAVLARNGVETRVAYPACCGSPQLELGELEAVAESAQKVSAELCRWVDRGYDVVALTPSCALMIKAKWPLITPEDANVRKLAAHTYDLSEYVVDIAGKEGLAEGLRPVEGGVSLHVACHARAQNIGVKARDLLKLIPESEIKVLPRCSGHGGTWGVLAENFETALKVGKPVARDAYKTGYRYVASECALAGKHIVQGLERQDAETPAGARKPIPTRAHHPIELLAMAYGVTRDEE